jgi:hypothetical protein
MGRWCLVGYRVCSTMVDQGLETPTTLGPYKRQTENLKYFLFYIYIYIYEEVWWWGPIASQA